MSDDAGAEPADDPEAGPRGAVFWVGLLAGSAVMVYAGWGAWGDRAATNPAGLIRWVVGAGLAHDLVLAPVIVLGGWLIGRTAPARWRGALRVGAALTGVVVLFAYPLVRAFGRHPLNSSTLPRNYVLDVALIVTGIWLVVTTWLVASRPRRDRPAPR
jgi:hypothetical protein